MNERNHYRLISESSTVTNNSVEAKDSDVSKESPVKPQTSSREEETMSVYESTEGNETSKNTSYDLASGISGAPFCELNRIFEIHRAELDEEKRSQYEKGVYAKDFQYKGKSKTADMKMASTPPNKRNPYPSRRDTANQILLFSNMSEALPYPNGQKTVSRKEDELNSIEKSNSLTCRCLQNMHLNKNHRFEGQKLPDVRESFEQSSIKTEMESKYQSSGLKTANHFENNLNLEGTGIVNPDLRNVPFNRCDGEKETTGGKLKGLKVRDEIINDYQLQEMICHKAIKLKLDEDYAEIQKLRRNYLSLRKLFLALAILNIILILCVISVMPFLLVTFKLSNEGNVLSEGDVTRVSAKHLSSAEAETIVKEHVFCVKCERLKESSSDFFTKEHFKSCCIKDVATFVDRILDFIGKDRDRLLEKISYDNRKQNDEIFALQSVVFNSSFNGSEHGALLIGQCERNYQLINDILTRKRLAVHLSGTGTGNRLVWTRGFSQGHSDVRHNLYHHSNMIKVKNGGVHFVYSCIHFDVGSCNSKSYIGYQILMKHGPEERVVASIHQTCVNGTSTEMVLTIHQMVNVPSGRDSTLHIKIDSDHLSISEQRRHYFGLFEI